VGGFRKVKVVATHCLGLFGDPSDDSPRLVIRSWNTVLGYDRLSLMIRIFFYKNIP